MGGFFPLLEIGNSTEIVPQIGKNPPTDFEIMDIFGKNPPTVFEMKDILEKIPPRLWGDFFLLTYIYIYG